MSNGRLPGDAWNAVFAVPLFIKVGALDQIQPVQTFEEYHRTLIFPNNPSGLEKFISRQDHAQVAQFDDIIRRMNAVIGGGVENQAQVSELERLLDEMRDLIFGPGA